MTHEFPPCSPDRTMDFFNRHAEGWDEDNRQAGEFSRLRRLLPPLGLGPSIRLLEVGCGTGRITPLLLELTAPDGIVTAMDFAPEMLHRARAKALGPRVTWLQGDAHHPPLPPRSHDWVLLYNIFPHLDAKVHTLTALARLLVPGGRLAICHLEGRENLNAFHAGLNGAVAHHMIPPRPVVNGMLADAGLVIDTWCETDDLYLVTAAPRQ